MATSAVFLKKFLSNGRQIPELSQVYHHVYFRETHGNYFAANDSALSFMGLSSNEQLTQYDPAELITDPCSLNIVLVNDKIIFDNKYTKVFQEAAPLENNSLNFLSIKSPLFSENKLIGLCGISVLIDNYNLTTFNTIITTVANLLEEDYSNNIIEPLFKRSSQPHLTPRELDCLQFYMRGYTTKNIATLLGLSNRTIEFYLDNIKSKFGVNKRSELLPLAFDLYPDLV